MHVHCPKYRLTHRLTKSVLRFRPFKPILLCIGALILILTLSFAQPTGTAFAQTATPEQTTEASTAQTVAPVVLGGEELFTVKASVGAFSQQDRAQAIVKRLKEVAEDASVQAEDITIQGRGETLNVVAGNRILVTVTAADAVAADQPQTILVNNYRDIVRTAVVQYREERTPTYIRQGLINTAWATLAFAVAIALLHFIYPRVISRIRKIRQRYIQSLRIRNVELLAAERLTQILYVVTKVVQTALYFGAFYIYVPLVLSFFPWTKAFGRGLLTQIHTGLTSLWQAFLAYLPNLFSIIFVVLVTYYFLRFLRQFFRAIGNGNITLEGFYPDWAQPTFRLLAILIVALAGVIVFPYFPGFGSPAFQGISIFLGVLFSLGSTAVVSNIVAGIILVYTRSFQLGDRVKIGTAVGDIISKTLLVTRIRTPKNVVISLPNAAVLSSEIVNYSAAQADPEQPPLMLNTTITLGYDVPWRKVHEVLLAAANATELVMTEPKPFILQTSLDDFYVSYELNAYTEKPAAMAKIYSGLHQNIQDKCNESDIEILSPHYRAARDGNLITIPESYLSADYEVPAFRVQMVKANEENRPS